MNNTNKRDRFEEPTSTTSTISPSPKITANTSPKGVALHLVRIFVTSLRKHLSPIILKAGESHIDHLHKLLTKIRQLRKMEDDADFIPRSARLVEFEFRTSKMVEDSPEFQIVKADTISLVSEFRLALKAKIIATLKIEIALLRTGMYENLMQCMHKCIAAHLISEQKNLDVNQLVSIMIKHHFDELFEHTDLKLNEFVTIYKKVHELSVFPTQTTTPIVAEPMNEEDDSMAADANPDIRHLAQSSKFLIFTVFTAPGRAYFTRATDIEIELTLKKFHTTDTEEEATSLTATRLNTETSVDNDLLESLITSQVTNRTKKLNSEIGQLKKQLATLISNSATPPRNSAPVKNPRGRPKKTHGASSNKKKSQSKSPSPSTSDTRRRKPAQQAGAQGNDATKKRRNSKKKPTKKKKGASN